MFERFRRGAKSEPEARTARTTTTSTTAQDRAGGAALADGESARRFARPDGPAAAEPASSEPRSDAPTRVIGDPMPHDGPRTSGAAAKPAAPADDPRASGAAAKPATPAQDDPRASGAAAGPAASAHHEPGATEERTRTHEPARKREPLRPLEPRHGTIDKGAMAAARARQREEYGGIHWGAAFFGFLAAMGLAAILTGIVSAAGATLAFGGADAGAETIGVVGAVAMLVVLVVAYFAGGYVAGRMSRFDGARQGLGVWIVALLVTVALAAAGLVLGGEYNVLERLNLPRIPVDEGAVATSALIALAAAVVGTMLAAMAGGKAGERYHKKIDRLAVDH